MNEQDVNWNGWPGSGCYIDGYLCSVLFLDVFSLILVNTTAPLRMRMVPSYSLSFTSRMLTYLLSIYLFSAYVHLLLFTSRMLTYLLKIYSPFACMLLFISYLHTVLHNTCYFFLFSWVTYFCFRPVLWVPVPFSSAIGRTLLPRYFRSIFEGGVTELYYAVKHPKESFHNTSITLDCDQCTMVTHHGKPMYTKVRTLL